MKYYEMAKIERVVVKKVICDNCKENCTQTYYDIISRASYSPEELIKTLCFRCHDDLFKKEITENHKKQIEGMKNMFPSNEQT